MNSSCVVQNLQSMCCSCIIMHSISLVLFCSNVSIYRAFRVRKKHSGDGGPGAIVSLIGDVLCEHIPQLQPYIRFCSCQLNASSLLQEKISNDAEFKKFVKVSRCHLSTEAIFFCRRDSFRNLSICWSLT